MCWDAYVVSNWRGWLVSIFLNVNYASVPNILIGRNRQIIPLLLRTDEFNSILAQTTWFLHMACVQFHFRFFLLFLLDFFNAVLPTQCFYCLVFVPQIFRTFLDHLLQMSAKSRGLFLGLTRLLMHYFGRFDLPFVLPHFIQFLFARRVWTFSVKFQTRISWSNS